MKYDKEKQLIALHNLNNTLSKKRKVVLWFNKIDYNTLINSKFEEYKESFYDGKYHYNDLFWKHLNTLNYAIHYRKYKINEIGKYLFFTFKFMLYKKFGKDYFTKLKKYTSDWLNVCEMELIIKLSKEKNIKSKYLKDFIEANKERIKAIKRCVDSGISIIILTKDKLIGVNSYLLSNYYNKNIKHIIDNPNFKEHLKEIEKCKNEIR